ncbi:hypothetical protein AMTR_s00039p00051030 [Amborella trichopoda]|uniref:Uncharacterized protein n=1 Tax=Amborella trichopoda TaxID=13333 RepID=U5D5V5_AMBTC|nr:hypothetical protein AMTR_s00039p00051030 [Amborella trichopoda]
MSQATRAFPCAMSQATRACHKPPHARSFPCTMYHVTGDTKKWIRRHVIGHHTGKPPTCSFDTGKWGRESGSGTLSKPKGKASS